LQAGTANDFVINRQRYTKPYIISVNLKGNPITPIIPKNGINITDKDGCGANVYYPADQTIEFKQTGAADCILDTIITNGLMGKVRYTMDPDQFWAVDGPTSFVDNVALILNINPTSIRVVSITKGSTIVDVNIPTPTQTPTADAATQTKINNEINSYIAALNSAIESGKMNVGGATVMDASFTPSVKNYNLGETSSPSTDNSGSTIGIIAGCIAAAVITIGAFLIYRKMKKNRLRQKVQPVPDKIQNTSKYADGSDISVIGEKTQEQIGLRTENSPERGLVGSVILTH